MKIDYPFLFAQLNPNGMYPVVLQFAIQYAEYIHDKDAHTLDA